MDRPRPATQQRPTKIIAYLEGDATVSQGKSKLTDRAWFGRFYTLGSVEMHVARVEAAPAQEPPLYQRAFKAFQPSPAPPRPVVQAQYTEPAGPPPLAPPVAVAPPTAIAPPEAIPPGAVVPGAVVPGVPAPGGVVVGETLPAGTRRIRAFGRSNIDPQVRWESDPQSGQWIGVISGGVNVIVDGLGIDARHSARSSRSTSRPTAWSSGPATTRNSTSAASNCKTRSCRWKSTWKATSSSARASA